MRIVAVDWSGQRQRAAQRRHIVMATAEDGVLVALSAGRTRQEVIDALIAMARVTPDLAVGLDFSFSFPRWFLDARGLTSAPDLWRLVAIEGEDWLRHCRPPFWGRPHTTRPEVPAHLRATVRAHPPAKSTFQIGGAGAVGTGSIRGMPHLLQLHEAGFCIWPFTAPGTPVVVEIYPRALTGLVTKRDATERHRFLEAFDLEPRLRAQAEANEDAFDAAVSAVVMSRHEDELARLAPATGPTDLLEGLVWTPKGAGPPPLQ